MPRLAGRRGPGLELGAAGSGHAAVTACQPAPRCCLWPQPRRPRRCRLPRRSARRALCASPPRIPEAVPSLSCRDVHVNRPVAVHLPVSQPRGPLPLDARKPGLCLLRKPSRGLAEHGEVPHPPCPSASRPLGSRLCYTQAFRSGRTARTARRERSCRSRSRVRMQTLASGGFDVLKPHPSRRGHKAPTPVRSDQSPTVTKSIWSAEHNDSRPQHPDDPQQRSLPVNSIGDNMAR